MHLSLFPRGEAAGSRGGIQLWDYTILKNLGGHREDMNIAYVSVRLIASVIIDNIYLNLFNFKLILVLESE